MSEKASNLLISIILTEAITVASTKKLVKRIVPVDLLFSEMGSPTQGIIAPCARWRDVPLVNLDPHMLAARYLMSGRGSLQPYLDYLRDNGADASHDILEKELRRQTMWMRRVLQRDMPIIAQHDRDRLILECGSILACVAKVRGKNWIHVLMPPEVAKSWDARPIAELDRVVRKQQREQFYTPVLHERYRKARVSREGSSRLDMIRTFLGPTHLPLTVLDIGCNTGFYTFHLARQGFRVTGIDVDETHLEVANALKTLYAADVELRMVPMQEVGAERRFDIALGMSVFWHLLGWGAYPQSITPEQLGDVLDQLVEHALFWEGGKRCDDEIALITRHSGLRHYTHLGTTHATGVENREFGVFTRRPAKEFRESLTRSDPPH